MWFNRLLILTNMSTISADATGPIITELKFQITKINRLSFYSKNKVLCGFYFLVFLSKFVIFYFPSKIPVILDRNVPYWGLPGKMKKSQIFQPLFTTFDFSFRIFRFLKQLMLSYLQINLIYFNFIYI